MRREEGGMRNEEGREWEDRKKIRGRVRVKKNGWGDGEEIVEV